MNINFNKLRADAGETTWLRGEEYFRKGLVKILELDAHSVKASVKGSYRYLVFLQSAPNELRCQCDCPVNADATTLCKHMVAVALAVAQKEANKDASVASSKAASSKAPPQTKDSLASFLRVQSADWLASTLINLAHKYPEIKRLIVIQQQMAGTTDIAALQKTLSGIIGRPRFLDYRASREYSRKLDLVLETLEQLFNSGQHGACVALSEYAIERSIKVYEQADDSSGEIGDVIAYIGEIYYRACVTAPVKEKPSASRYLKLLMLDGWGFISQYDLAAILGEQSALALESKISELWAALPTKTHNPDDPQAFKIQSLMEDIAKKNGDVDLLIRIYSRDIAYEYGYLRIVAVCREYHRPREAIQWAERGIKAHPTSNQLRGSLAEMYLNDGLQEEALSLYWQNFLHQPTTNNYLELKVLSGSDWPLWRRQAMEKLITTEQKVQAHYSRHNPAAKRVDASLRISCLLAEDSLDEARSILLTHQSSRAVLVQLARRIHRQYPLEAVAHLQTVIAEITVNTNNQAYHQACAYLSELRPWLPPQEFDAYLESLKLKNKSRPNFMKLLAGF